MRIALDAMGGDNAPGETVRGAIEAAREYGVEVVLVGKPEVVEGELAKGDTSGLRLPIEPAGSVIPMDEHAPSTAWRRQADSSLSVGLRMLAEGRVDAVVSAGNTGAVVDRNSTRLNSSHPSISYAVFCLKKKRNPLL